TVGADCGRYVVAVDLLRAVERPQVNEGPPAVERVKRLCASKAPDRKAIHDIVIGQHLSAIADRQQIVESDPGKVVESFALDEIVSARVVASRVLVGEVRVAIDVALDLAEIADRCKRIDE